MYTTNLSLMAMLGGAVVMAASQEGPRLQVDGGETIDASFEYSFDEESGSLGSHMLTLNAEFMDGTGTLTLDKPVDVALCFEWLDTSDVKLIKCITWNFLLSEQGGEEMEQMSLYAMTSTGASTLDDAVLSGADDLAEQFQSGDVFANGWDVTDAAIFLNVPDNPMLSESFENWSVVQDDLVVSGSKLTGVIALELVDESELAALRDGDSIPGVCTIHFEGVTVSSNVNIVIDDGSDPEEESAARLSSSLLTLAMFAIWTASI